MTASSAEGLAAFEAVTARFFQDLQQVTAVAGSAHLARVEGADGAWILRRWPEGAAIPRVAFVHEALRLAREGNVDVVPEMASAVGGGLAGHPTIAVHDSRLYDAQRWMPGQVALRRPTLEVEGDSTVDLPGPLPDQLVLETAGLIARFHAETSGALLVAGAPRSALGGFGAAANRVWRQRLRDLDPLAPEVPAVRRWRAAARRVVTDALARIEEAGAAGQATEVVVHANLWPSHVLASPLNQRQAVMSIVDWTDAIGSSPLVDIAHLIVHFGGWTPENAEAVISAYHDVRPLRPAERRLLPAVAALDLAAQTGRLLSIGYGGGFQLDQGERSLARNSASDMTTSLETLANVLEYGETRPPRQFRKWVYREPPTRQRAKGGNGRSRR